MTTIAIVAGMLPIAFGKGAGAGSRASMAVTILGGQVLCLLLTLLVTPVVYSYFDDLREWSPTAAFKALDRSADRSRRRRRRLRPPSALSLGKGRKAGRLGLKGLTAARPFRLASVAQPSCLEPLRLSAFQPVNLPVS